MSDDVVYKINDDFVSLNQLLEDSKKVKIIKEKLSNLVIEYSKHPNIPILHKYVVQEFKKLFEILEK